MWRVLTGRSKHINYSFLPVGHTKFSPDWCFGLLKKKYRSTEVNCLNDISIVVEKSSSVNTAQLVGTSNGEILVPMYDWTGYFAPIFRRFPNIKKYNHYSFSALNKGEMTIKKLSNSPPSQYELLKNNALLSPQVLPDIIHPKGLPPNRQWYLYEKIREYCSIETQDTTCPLPTVPRPGTPCVTPLNISPESSPSPPSIPSSSSSRPNPSQITVTQTPLVSVSLPQYQSTSLPSTSLTSNQPSLTSSRCCSKCGQRGHNIRTCNMK
jgi:hypothetical protein